MTSEQVVTGADLSDVSKGMCALCIEGKMTRKPFKSENQIKFTPPLLIIS